MKPLKLIALAALAVLMSARDVGNIVAGYYAGSNGFPWAVSRFVFDFYQGSPEGEGTKAAQKLGWSYGISKQGKTQRLKNSTPSLITFIKNQITR